MLWNLVLFRKKNETLKENNSFSSRALHIMYKIPNIYK